MVPTKGLFTDCNPIDQPPGTWRDARNLLISKTKGAYTNEDGTIEVVIPDVVIPSQTITAPPLSSYFQLNETPIKPWVLGSNPTFTGAGVYYSNFLVGAATAPINIGDTVTINYNFDVSGTGITYGAVRIFAGVYKVGGNLLDGIITQTSIDLPVGNTTGTLTIPSVPASAGHIFMYIVVNATSMSLKVNKFSTPDINIPGGTYTTQPIGTAVFPDNTFVVFSAGTTSRIGLVDINSTYQDIIVDSALALSTSFPIRSAETQYDFFGNRIIAWTDFNNITRILNIDNLPVTLNTYKGFNNSSDVKLLDIFPTLNTPDFTFVINQSGGSLKAGAYSYAISYSNPDGTKTVNTTPLKTIYITDDSISLGDDKYNGVVPGTITSKSITLTFSNLDIRYQKVTLIGFSRINNQVSVFEIKTVQSTSSTLTITHIGSENTTTLSLEEVLTTRPVYTKSYALAQLNNRLYQGNLEAALDVNLQAVANNVKIFYNTRLVSISDLNNSQKSGFPGGYAHSGVYAFYLCAKLTNGSYSRGFHIPGPTLTEHPFAVNTSLIANSAGINALVYQVEDTTNQTGGGYFSDNGTIRRTSLSGNSNMGYWENKDEEYPIGSNFPQTGSSGDGRRVRHHTFPSKRKCKQLHYNSEVGYGRDKMDILGIDIANVIIPDELKSQVVGWAVFYAQRDTVNSTTFGSDLYLCSHSTDTDSTRIAFAGGNWVTDARQPSGDGDSDYGNDFNPRQDYLRGHSFQLLKDKPNLGTGNLFIDLEFQYTKTQAKLRYQDVGKAGCNIAKSGKDVSQDSGGIIDITDTVNCSVSMPANQLIRRIDTFRYLPSNIIDGNVSTFKNEETILLGVFFGFVVPLEMSKIGIFSPTRDNGFLFGDNGDPIFPNGGEQGYIMTYRQIKNNLFANFDQQILVATDSIGFVTDSQKTNVYGGDTFISQHSFICSFGRHANDIGGPDGVSIIRNYICEGKYNIGLRYEVSGDITTKYYPKTQPTEFWTNPSNVDTGGIQMIFDRQNTLPNNYGYSDDYNAVNNLVQPVIYNFGQITTNKFPYRVIRSGVSSTIQNTINSWKTYLSADYYEGNRNRGRIENLVVLEDTLLIHHYYGLFYTLGSQKLALGATEVFLGTSDIFEQVPKESVATKLGYLGNQNIFASFSYKGNYAWIDQSQGRVFTISKSGVVELSDNGLFNFFRDNTLINNSLPNNPIVDQGLIGGYDPRNNRLIFTKKSSTNAFTISYSLDYNCWDSYHDYIPSLYFNTNKHLYGITNKIYSFDNENVKGVFFGSNPYPTYITRVFNDSPNLKKIMYNLNWITQIEDSSGNLIREETLDRLQAQSSFQDTGEIVLVPHKDFNNRGNIRNLRNEWNFNKLKDTNSNPFNKRPLMDQYFIVRFQYDNKINNLDNSQNSLYLYLLACNFRQSEL